MKYFFYFLFSKKCCFNSECENWGKTTHFIVFKFWLYFLSFLIICIHINIQPCLTFIYSKVIFKILWWDCGCLHLLVEENFVCKISSVLKKTFNIFLVAVFDSYLFNVVILLPLPTSSAADESVFFFQLASCSINYSYFFV